MKGFEDERNFVAHSHPMQLFQTYTHFCLFINLNQPTKKCHHKLSHAPKHTLIILPYFENQIQSLSLAVALLISLLNSQIRMYILRSLSHSQIGLCVFKRQRFNSPDP